MRASTISMISTSDAVEKVFVYLRTENTDACLNAVRAFIDDVVCTKIVYTTVYEAVIRGIWIIIGVTVITCTIVDNVIAFFVNSGHQGWHRVRVRIAGKPWIRS
jgi:hypothetical protein